MTTKGDNFHYALNTANSWLADVCTEFGTSDRRFAYRALRAWLHTMRDRLTVDSAAKFGAQLPEMLRGIYYDGWDPSRVPIKFGADEYVERFAATARISAGDVRHAAATVSRALGNRLSPGQLDEALAQIPGELRPLVGGGRRPGQGPAGEAKSRTGDQHATTPSTLARLDALEKQVGDLVEAVRTLARGLEGSPLAGTAGEPGVRAARLADEILMTTSRA
jgi:uncharacterized protein (DUF2267 family)